MGSLVSSWGPRRDKACRVSLRSPQSASRVPLRSVGLPGRECISSLPPSKFQRPGRWTSAGKAGSGQRPCWSPEVAQVPKDLHAQFGEPLGGSEAEAELFAHVTAVALHHAAPVETAQAVLLELHALLAVPAAAAQQVAAAEVRGAAVAGAAARAWRAGAPVGGAEVGRVGGIE